MDFSINEGAYVAPETRCVELGVENGFASVQGGISPWVPDEGEENVGF